MIKYNELIGVMKNDPCEEYPGKWIVSIPECLGSYWSKWWNAKNPEDSLGHFFASQKQAENIARRFLDYMQEIKVEYDPRQIKIVWIASDNDPRNGNDGFSLIRLHGQFNFFGEYKAN